MPNITLLLDTDPDSLAQVWALICYVCSAAHLCLRFEDAYYRNFECRI